MSIEVRNINKAFGTFKVLNEVSLDFPTGALVEIELPIDHWRDAGEGAGRLVRFLRPRELP